MKKLWCICLALVLSLAAANGLGEGLLGGTGKTASPEGALLGELDARLETMEGSDFYFYSQLNNVLGNNRIVYDENFLYFAWGNSLYCANYDGSDVWEITDMLADGSPIALQGDRIYCLINSANTIYFASMKTDGSETPDLISDLSQIKYTLIHQNGSLRRLSITRISVPRNSGGKVYFVYSGGDTWDHFGSGIATYNIEDRVFSKIAWRDSENQVATSWFYNGILVYEIGGEGIKYYDLAESAIVISNTHLKRIIYLGDRIYFIEKDTNRLYTIATTGSQKRKLLDGVTEFVLTENNLLLYTTNDGLYAADEKAQNTVKVTDAITGRFYLMGDWVYYYTDDNIQRMSLRDGSVQVVFDPSWV